MGPEETLRRYFEYLKNERYADASALLSAECLRQFREQEAPHMRPGPRPTVEGYLERDPEIPREVAEHWVAQAERHPTPTLSDFFAGVDSAETLKSLSDTDLFARHLEARDHTARHRRLIDNLRERHPEHEAELLRARDSQSLQWGFRMFGAIVTDDRAYVLFGWPEPEDPSMLRFEATPHVAVLRICAEQWRIAANPSPYSGMLIALGPIAVTGDDGKEILLDPNHLPSASPP